MRLFFLPFILSLAITGGVLLKGSLTNVTVQQPVEEKVANADNGGNIAFVDEVKGSTGEWIENAGLPIFDDQILTTPPKLIADIPSGVLGSTTAADGSEKWIEIDLSDQKLFAWEGGRKVYDFAISSGRPGYKTVTGEFRVWRKVESQRYVGGSKARGDYYNLPNVPWSLFFYKGYAIHGAYWHNDFGIKTRSSGCVNLHPDNARQVYFWAGPAMPEGKKAVNSTPDNPGVRVVVHD